MRTLDVHYCGWGEDWRLGTLAEDDSTVLFEYSPQALAQGLELSPLHLALRAQAYAGFPSYLHRLPGVIADSLPDGWGLLLMDRLFRQQGLRHPTPLDRLAFIADRAMGALRFVPAAKRHVDEPGWDLLTLAQEDVYQINDKIQCAVHPCFSGAEMGRPYKIDPTQEAVLLEIVKSASFATMGEVKAELQRRTGLEAHEQTILKALLRLGVERRKGSDAVEVEVEVDKDQANTKGSGARCPIDPDFTARRPERV